MSSKTKIEIPAFRLPSVLAAFRMFSGDRPTMLSYRMGRILAPVSELHEKMIERLRPYLADNGALRPVQDEDNPDGLTQEDMDQVDEILNETLTFHVRPISLKEIDEAGLVVRGDDDTIIPFLVREGFINP